MRGSWFLALAFSFRFTTAALGEPLILPQIADGPSWSTTVRIINLFNQRQRLKLTAFRSDRTPWVDLGFSWRFSGTYEPNANGEFEIGVDPFAVMEVESFRQSFSRDANTDVAGYLIVDANPELTKVSAFLNYHPPGGARGSLVGVLRSPLITGGSVPFDRDTAVAIVNPSDEPIRVNFQMIYSDIFGADRQRTFSIDLLPKEHQAFFLKEKVDTRTSVTSDYFGYANIFTSNGSNQFSVMALIFRSDGLVTSLPVHVRFTGPF